MNIFTADWLRHLFDLVVMTFGLGVLIYSLSRTRVRQSVFPAAGRWFLVTGTVLIVLTHWTNIIAADLSIWIFGVEEAHWLSDGIPGWLFWLLSRAAVILILAGLLMFIWSRKRLERVVSTTRDMIRDAQDNVAQSEARFRYLFETTSNSVFCYVFDPPMPISLPVVEQVRRSHDAILTECNTVFAQMLDAANPSAVIGTRMGILDGNTDSEAHFAYFSAFVENGYQLTDYDLIYKTPDGEDRAVRSSLTGIVKDGMLHRFWGAESNILQYRQTRAALDDRRQFQDLVASIASRLVTARIDRADEVVRDCLVDLCQFVDADRTALIWYDRDSREIELSYSFTASGEYFEAPLSLTTYPHTTAMLLANKVVTVDDTAHPPEEVGGDRDVFLDRELRSFAALPLDVDGDVVGVVTYAYTSRSKRWSGQDIADLKVFADLFASFVSRMRSRRALDEALLGLQRATDRLSAENVYLRGEVERQHGFDEIIGESEGVLRCLRMVEQVAATATPVLLLGETGTGKELMARAIHEHSDRRDRPLVKVNCAALPANLIESELFGYEKGAFTGADRPKRGRFDLADGSTLFLDEIGEIPMELQPKLLRVLQEGEFERLGGGKSVKVDVRIIAATNRNLSLAVNAGEFRSDLYYRINTFPIELPPLRERGGDIQMLAEHFVKDHAQSLGREVKGISAEMMRQLCEYSWPGNVRELDGVIQRAMISTSGKILELADPLASTARHDELHTPRILSTTIADLRFVEREHILSVLETANWKISGKAGAASRLGIPPSTLRSKMKRLAIVRPD